MSEFWFLDIAVRGMPCVRQVASTPDELIAHFNVIPHKLDSIQVVDILLRMHREGEIYFCLCSGDKLNVSRDDLIATVLSAIPQSCNEIHYGLTNYGAARWESTARPNWERYYHDSYNDGESPNETELILSACNEDRLREIFEHFSYAVFDIPQGFDQSPKERISPWWATYWKAFPEGVRIRCNVTEKLLVGDQLRRVEEYLFRSVKGRTMKMWRRYGMTFSESECLYG